MANFTFGRVREIMRRVIGRRNDTDTLSTDNELQSYIGEFMRDLMPQETKAFENFGTYTFNTVADIEVYTFNTSSGAGGNTSDGLTIGDGESADKYTYENIGPVAYSDEQLMNWHQDPAVFFDKWGFDTNVTTVQTAQPIDILFHQDYLRLKPRPDDAYTIRIFGFKRNVDYTAADGTLNIQSASDNIIPSNYWGRYIAYGAALDYMYDFGFDPKRIEIVESRYKHYKALVHSRTFNQFNQETPIPRW